MAKQSIRQTWRLWISIFVAVISGVGFGTYATARDFPQNRLQIQVVRSSPFDAPEKNDTTFVVDEAPGLDTGCTFRSGGPLVFNIPVTRFIGDVSKLRASGAIKPNAKLRMPAFDVDFSGSPGFPPERDRVFFNGHVVPTEFLQGANNTWILNSFEVPVEWIIFPNDPGKGGTVQESLNEIRIDIDTASPPSEENWCTSIDWAALTIEVARPNLLVHGICVRGICDKGGNTWTDSNVWPNGISTRGIPFDDDNIIDMGRLDTIGSNAKKIEAKVAELMRRFGVDKINIVAHSKGGIDSRHFAENKSEVARLSQIGTPNSGSPLADYIQSGSLLLSGIGGNFGLNMLAGGPGGYQLTTPYMNAYNFLHGFNPDTIYVSLAGDYSGGGLVDSLLNNIIPGNDDTIVPVSSVHALPYASHLTYSSSGTNKQAKHTEQSSSPDIFNRLISFTSAPVSASAALAQSVPSQTIFNTAPIPGTVSTGQTQVHTIPVDNTGSGAISLIYNTGNLDMVLVSPSGLLINPSVAQSDPNIAFEASENVEGLKMEIYTFDTFEVGKWTAEVTGINVPIPPGEESYLVGAWLQESTVGLSVETDKQSYASGNAIAISATLVNSALSPVLGANVTATVGLPDNTVSNVKLLDNGLTPDSVFNDGIYTGAFKDTTLSGIYQLAITAQGTQPPFSRDAYLQRPVSISTSSFSGGFSDQGLDTNKNGLFDLLVIDVPVNITKDATYFMTGELTSPDGTLVGTTSTRIPLSQGGQSIQLKFNGQTIFQKKKDGPYVLHAVRLAEETSSGDILPLAEKKDAYNTKAYSFREFERAAIFIPGTGSDTGIDTNGNGQFDQLEIRLDTDMLEADTYQWSAHLVDKDDKEIAVTANAAALNAGPGVISLIFDGATIQQHGVAGPYKVTNLLIFGSHQSQVIFEVYTTNGYKACQFEGGTCNQAPVSHAGSDRTMSEGSLVTLDGTGSFDPEGAPITYNWTQIEGPAVVLSDPKSPKPSFRAPFVSANTSVTFQLIVNDGSVDSLPDQIIVTVTDQGPSLHGTVREKKANTPIKSAIVKLVGTGKIRKQIKWIRKNTTTDSNGFYAFTGLLDGHYVVQVFPPKPWHPDFRPAIKVIDIKKGEDERQDFLLRAIKK